MGVSPYPLNGRRDGSTAAETVPPVGLVLAGGASRRMGSDKAMLAVGGETLAGRAARLLAAACAEVAVADGGRRLLPGRPSVADGPGRGPAAGILGGARAYPGRLLLVLACDLPRVPSGLLAELARPEPGDWAVPRWRGGLEPLCALYGPAALAALAEQVVAGDLAPHHLAEAPGLAVRYLDEEQLAAFGEPAELFLNVNSPEDLARLTHG